MVIKLCMTVLWLVLGGASLCHASERVGLAATCNDYFTYMKYMDLSSAARMVHPDDLVSIRSALYVPMRNALSTGSREKKELAKVFFSNIPVQGREYMTDEEMFIGMMNLAFFLTPEIRIGMRKSEIANIEIFLSNENNAICAYALRMENASIQGTEKFTKRNGVWYIRLKQNPKSLGALLDRIP